MIARGDLAVELSFERLAEMQEQILWFGEACHLPVIWATQVLDSVAHTGLATRAEVTDAAMSVRAERVMLNKGPHIGAAVRMLADIIRKMEAHQFKKRSLYRPLSVARGAF
jgi:pyruvate kinase